MDGGICEHLLIERQRLILFAQAAVRRRQVVECAGLQLCGAAHQGNIARLVQRLHGVGILALCPQNTALR